MTESALEKNEMAYTSFVHRTLSLAFHCLGMTCRAHEGHVMTWYMKIVQESYSSADQLVPVSTAFTYGPKKFRHQDRDLVLCFFYS